MYKLVLIMYLLNLVVVVHHVPIQMGNLLHNHVVTILVLLIAKVIMERAAVVLFNVEEEFK